MNFGAASFLWFLPLLSVPILIHLFEKKRAIVHAFAATEFVLKSIEKVKKKINLKSLLLLILRTAGILSIILIFAEWGRQSLPVSEKKEQKKDIVVVLDASASMQWVNGQGDLFSQAKKDARNFIEHLPASNRVSVVVFAKQLQSTDRPLSIDREQVLKAIDQSKVTFEGTNPQVAFQAVQSILDKSKVEPTQSPVEVHVFSDWTSNPWKDAQNILMQAVKPKQVPLKLIAHEIKRDPAVSEVALENFQWSAADLPAQRFQVDIKNLMLRNAPASALTFAIRPLSQDAPFTEIVRSENSLSPSEVKTIPFDFRSRSSGVEMGRLAITEKDALSFNNELYFLVSSPKRAKILIVDGEKDLNPFLSETFFLNKALTEGAEAEARFFVVNTSSQEIGQHVLSNYDVVVLANVNRLPQGKMIELRSFLESGGGVFVSLGDQINVEEFNKNFRNIFPIALRDVVAEEKGVGLRTLSFEKETQRIFGKSLSVSDLHLLEFVKIFKYFVFETQSFGKYKTLLSLSSGSPMLLWGNLGKGQFGIWASSLDREWNDFPVQTTFLPFMQTLLQSLSNSDALIDEMDLVVGEGKSIQSVRDVKVLKIINSEGQEVDKYSLDQVQGDGSVTLQSPTVPGVYWVNGIDQNGDVLTKTLLKVGVPPEENQADILSTADLLEMTQEKAVVRDDRGEASKQMLVSFEDRGSHIFYSFVPALLMALVMLLFLESWVSAR